MPRRMNNIILWLCLSTVIVVPFANDSFISALPIMRNVFGTSHIGLILTVYFAGLAISQPIYGPLTDRFGRKVILLVGLLIFIAGSLITINSTNFHMFLCGRFTQALGACATVVITYAIIRDVCSGHQLATFVGALTAVIGICPTVAPLVGSYLTEHFGWKSSFILLLCLGIFYLSIITIFLKETAEKNIAAAKTKTIILNYKTIFSNTIYRNYCLISAINYGTLFCFFSVASIFIVHLYGVSLVAFGWLTLINGAIIFLTSLIGPRITKKLNIKTTIILGTSFITTGAICMLLINLFIAKNVITFIGPMFIITLGVGLIRPSVVVGAISQTDKKISGTAVAGFNFCSYVGGSLFTLFSGKLHLPIDYAGFITIAGIVAIMLCVLTPTTTVAQNID